MNRIILASASPRRRELAEKLGYEFEVMSVSADEAFDAELSPEENVEAAAVRKAAAGARAAKLADNDVVLGADTVVVQDGRVLGKPHSRAEAKAMLTALSGKSHVVLSGVGIIAASRSMSFCAKTTVRFSPLSEAQIEEYLNSGEPFDKAGAYGIQGQAAKFIEGIDGDYYNVMGLPINRIYRVLRAYFGFSEDGKEDKNEYFGSTGTAADK